MKKIVCFHLLNDYSGSPKVLNLILKGLSMKGYEIDLVTSRNTGILCRCILLLSLSVIFFVKILYSI